MHEPGIRRVDHPTPLPWIAEAYDGRTRRRKRKQFRTLAEARVWRQEMQTAIRKGEVRVTVAPTLREACADLVDGMRSGAIPARGGQPYRAAVVRKYESTLRVYVLDDLGGRRVNDISHVDLLDHADRLRARGLAPNTVRRAFDPLRVVMRRAVQRGWIGANPCAGLELPTGMVKPRERVLDPSEIAEMIEALTDTRDRALWAAAFHAGMRFGELRALRWEHVDLAASRLHVRESMDDKKAITAPKTKAGVRTLPITLHLRKPLVALRAERDGDPAAFVFGDARGRPFANYSTTRKAHKQWLAAGLAPVTLHEARHACITIWAQAIANPKRVQSLAGHASITMTLDRYGKHMALGTDEAAAEVTRFLELHGG
jgi:integrase